MDRLTWARRLLGGAAAVGGVQALRALAPVRPELWRVELVTARSVRDVRRLAQLRELLGLATGGRPGVEVSRRRVTHAGHEVTVLWFEPRRRTAAGAYLWCHGGGLVAGSAAADTAHCSQVAAELGVPVVAVDYRLAPEHPYPAALEDAHTALRWLIDDADRLGHDADHVAIGGASAGGGLAAAVCHRVRDRGERPASRQVLRYPMLDHRTRGRWWQRYPWSPASNRFAWRCYLGDALAAPPGHAVPALAEDLAGLPPAWVGVGTADLFHAECRRYAARLVSAGVSVTFDSVPGMYHGADGTAPESASMRAFRSRETNAVADGVGVRQTARP